MNEAVHFANPHALWLLLLLPLLLFARRREPASRRQVATLHLWREMAMSEASAPSRRLRSHWLVVLQAACLAAIVLALARPMLAFSSRTVAIVIDTSLSMATQQGDTTRLELAKRRTATLLETLPRGTRVLLVEADAAPHVAGAYTARDPALTGAVRALDPTDGASDLESAIERAAAADGETARIYVLTDADRLADGATAARDVAWTSIGEPANNVAITALTYRRASEGAPVIDVLTEVRNFGSADLRSELLLELANATVGREAVAVSARGSVTILTTLPDTPGVLTARLDRADALNADNVRRIVIESPPRLRVRLQASPATPTNGSYFVRTALASHPQVTLVADGEPYDVIVCDGCPDVPGDAGVLLIAPRQGGVSNDAPVTWTGHPLSRLFALDHLSIVAVPVSRDADESTVVARAGGLPVILAYEAGGRRVMEWRLDPDASALPLSPAFPVLIARALEWLDPGAGSVSAIVAGDPVQWTLPRGRAPEAIAIRGPDARERPAPFSDGRVLLADTSAAGVYRVQLAGEERTFVVNPDAGRESDVSRPAGAASGASQVAADGRALHEDAAGALLLIALVLLGTEWHYRRHRRWVPQGRT